MFQCNKQRGMRCLTAALGPRSVITHGIENEFCHYGPETGKMASCVHSMCFDITNGILFYQVTSKNTLRCLTQRSLGPSQRCYSKTNKKMTVV